MYISQDGTCVNIKDETDLETFLSFKEESKQNNAEQKMLDELVRQTPDVTKVNYFFHEKGCDKVSTIERINHNIPCCCLRNFTYLNNTVNVLETMRIYIFKDKIVSAKRNNNNEYIFSTLEKLEAWNCSLDYISPEVGKGTKLEYFTSIVNELIPSYRPRLLFLCINFPAFESLYKSGYRNIASAILENNSIEEIFNEITPNQNNLYKVFGINKYQFDKLNKELSSFGELVLIKPDGCDKSNINMSKNEYKNILSKVKNTNFNIIKNIKTLLNSNNISNLDNETFDFLFEICHNNYIINIAKLYIEIYGLSSFFDKKDFWIYWYNVSKSSFFYNYNNLFIDTLTMIKDMNLQNNIKVNWMSTNSMVEAHDFIQSAYETEINALKIKKFTNNCKKLEKYKFANSKYIIVVPTVPNQLAIEGIELHHCVKSYINKVVDGITGIVFIREKENIDKPFFTVEIQNDTVMQIHGFSNCNVTESSLKTFVKKWITIKNLKENPDGFNIVR